MEQPKEPNWLEVVFNIHQQSHIYWKTIITVPLLIIGWSTTTNKMNILLAWLLVIFIIALELFLAQALLKVYSLMRGGFEEYKNLYTPDKGPFYQAVHEIKLLKKWQVLSVSIFMITITCSSVLYIAYSS